MPERFQARSAVMLLLKRGTENATEILLQKRKNTGYMDGMWDLAAAGHVDEGESMKMAMLREAKEELNIDLAMPDIEFITMTHKNTPATGIVYYNAYFSAERFGGVPVIHEPDKCEKLQWFDIMALPPDLIPDRARAVYNALHHVPYDEEGWD